MTAISVTTDPHPSEEVRLEGGGQAHADSPATLADAAGYFVRRASPLLLITAFVAAATARIALGGFTAWDLVPIAVLVAVWPLQEWLIHVYILHFRPFVVAGRVIDFTVPRKHRQHHRDPGNLDILFIPLHSYAYTLPLTLLLWFGVAPDARLALTGLTFHYLFSLNYEWVHFLVHTRVVPKSAMYRRLWRSHRLHHFKNEHYWMGVSRLGADRILGTSPDPTAVATSRTCRDLLASG